MPAIIELARDNGARAIAQGIETRADFLAAHDMGFDLVQGYLFGKPVAVRKFAGRPRPQLRSQLRQDAMSVAHSNFMSMHFAMSEPGRTR